MANRSFNGPEKAKLTQIVNEGIIVLEEIDALNAGLKDTIDAIAEELDIKPSLLKKAIKLAQKGKFTEATEDYETVTDILETVGKTI